MQFGYTRRVLASVALVGAFFVPTAAYAAVPSDTEAVTTDPTQPQEISQEVGDFQLVVGEPTPTEPLVPGLTASAVWSRGAAVVGTSVGYTPVEADRGQVLQRVLTYTVGGVQFMVINQTFTLPVL